MEKKYLLSFLGQKVVCKIKKYPQNENIDSSSFLTDENILKETYYSLNLYKNSTITIKDIKKCSPTLIFKTAFDLDLKNRFNLKENEKLLLFISFEDAVCIESRTTLLPSQIEIYGYIFGEYLLVKHLDRDIVCHDFFEQTTFNLENINTYPVTDKIESNKTMDLICYELSAKGNLTEYIYDMECLVKNEKN
jgi:hypothetical protein